MIAKIFDAASFHMKNINPDFMNDNIIPLLDYNDVQNMLRIY